MHMFFLSPSDVHTIRGGGGGGGGKCGSCRKLQFNTSVCYVSRYRPSMVCQQTSTACVEYEGEVQAWQACLLEAVLISITDLAFFSTTCTQVNLAGCI